MQLLGMRVVVTLATVLIAMETLPHVTVIKSASSIMIVALILVRYVQWSHLLIQHKVQPDTYDPFTLHE